MTPIKIMPPRGRTAGTWKMGTTVYHVAPTSVRDQILRDGLIAFPEEGEDPNELGVYGWPELRSAQLTQREYDGIREVPHDIWAVHGEYNWQPDPYSAGVYTDSEIHPQDLELITPADWKEAGLWEQPSQFQIPHSVEQAFVRAMECPMCHSNLLLDQPPPKSSEKVYCPVCGWKPREAKTATTTRKKLLEMKAEMDAVLPEKGVKHDLGNGYHVYHPETWYDVAREGTLMENCTSDEGCHDLQRDVMEGRQPEAWTYDKPYKQNQEIDTWAPAYLRDNEGIPHAMWTHEDNYAPEEQAMDAEGRRGQPLKEEYIQMIHQYYAPNIPYEDYRERYAKTARHVDVEIRKEDNFYPKVEGVTMEQLAALGVEPQIYNAYDGDKPVGSVVFFKLEDRRLLSLVPDAPEEPVMWVEWIWVDDDYRDTDVFSQLALIVKQAAGDLPIEAYYRNERLKRVIDRYFQRGSAFDTLPPVNPVSYQFTPFTDYENEMYDALDNGTKSAYRRRARNVNRRVQRQPGATGTVTGKQLWMLQNRWGGKCAYCGQDGADSWDHVVPLGQGGANAIENLLPCHIPCNKELNEWQNRNQDYKIRDPHPNWLTVPATDPLEAHHSAPNGMPQQAWSLTSAWKRIEPHGELRDLAQSYMDNKGWKYNPPRDYPDVDSERAARIAQEYEAMEHNPNDPRVRAAYEALARETADQYEHLVNNGYSMEFEPEGGAYASPWDSTRDVRENKHLYVYPTAAGFGSDQAGADHPLLQDSGYRWNGQTVTYNDLFRGVHDVFGHAKEGVGFRHDGEENAWRQHSAMFSEPARHALTSETRGQNSWVNFGPYGEHNQTADQESTVYAPQKAGLMPEWATWEGASDTYG